MRDHELQRHLGPAVAVDLGGPARQPMAPQHIEQPPFAERAVDDDGDAPLLRQRQDALLDLTVQQVVCDLDEVDGLRAQDLLDLGLAPAFGGGNADVTQSAGRLHRQQAGQMFLPGMQVVHLHQVEARHAPEGARGLHLRSAACRVADPHLLGRKQRRRPAEPRQRMADGRLRRAVHRRTVDHPATGREESTHDLGTAVARCFVVTHVEGDPTAQADQR